MLAFYVASVHLAEKERAKKAPAHLQVLLIVPKVSPRSYRAWWTCGGSELSSPLPKTSSLNVVRF